MMEAVASAKLFTFCFRKFKSQEHKITNIVSKMYIRHYSLFTFCWSQILQKKKLARSDGRLLNNIYFEFFFIIFDFFMFFCFEHSNHLNCLRYCFFMVKCSAVFCLLTLLKKKREENNLIRVQSSERNYIQFTLVYVLDSNMSIKSQVVVNVKWEKSIQNVVRIIGRIALLKSNEWKIEMVPDY